MDNSSRVFTTYIQTTPERLWHALTTPEFTRRYFYRADVESTWAPGAPVAYRAGGQVLQEGRVLAADPPARLVVRCSLLFDPEARRESPFRMAWDIRPLDELCKLTLTVDELAGAPRNAALTAGLGPVLGALKTLLETGRPRPIANVTVDCRDPGRLAAFWAVATGHMMTGGGEGWAAIEDAAGVGPRLLFLRVPEPKSGKNRVHLDLNVEDMEAEAARLAALGARRLRTVEEGGGRWTVMADPEGNEFCIQ